MTKFRLIIADKIKLPIELTVNDEGKSRAFKFSLVAKRVPIEGVRAIIADGERSVREVLQEHIVGWQGQALVIDDEDKPAEFTPEALDVMLSLPGVEGIVLASFLKEQQASDAREGRAKN